MGKFLQFPEGVHGVADVLWKFQPFSGYPWIVYGDEARKEHLGFNGEDINLSLDWYASGYNIGKLSDVPLVRLMVALAQRRNPVPRAKGQRSKNYNIWIPAKHVERFFGWDNTPVELPKAMLTMFDKVQKGRLRAAYAKLAEVFPPAVGHEELHTDIGGYDESGLSSLIAKEERFLRMQDEKLKEEVKPMPNQPFVRETEEELMARARKMYPNVPEERIRELWRHMDEMMPILQKMSRR